MPSRPPSRASCRPRSRGCGSHHPDLRVRLGEVTPSTLEARFLSGEFDVAISYQDATTERRELAGAERIDLMQDTFLVGLPPEHRLARRRPAPISLTELAEDDWIFASTEGFLVQACRDAGFDPRIVATTSEPLATRGLIAPRNRRRLGTEPARRRLQRRRHPPGQGADPPA